MRQDGAVVVLYEPSAAQLAALHRLRRQCPRVLAVDNSPQPRPELREQLALGDVQLLRNGNVGGIAGAFNRGIEALLDQGCEAVFLFDQDSQPPADFCRRMLDGAAHSGETRLLLGPRIYDVHVGDYLPAFTLAAFDERGGPQRCAFLISSGTLLSAAAWRQLGGFREDYVIDHVDTEYCLRARRLGVPLFLHPGVTLRHAIGRRVRHRLLGLRLGAMNHAPARRYYLARNALHLGRLYGPKLPVLLVNLLSLSQLLAVLLFERDKRRKALALLAGSLDGLRGQLGVFGQRWPRLASWCARGA